MKTQQYHNHARIHPLYHYILMPLAVLTLAGTLLHLFPRLRGGLALWDAVVLLIAAAALGIAVLLIRSYAAKLQDRVIRAEENFRHYVLTGRILDPALTLSQIIALRFAADDQFPALCEQAVRERLRPDAIKRAIQTWKPDYLRV